MSGEVSHCTNESSEIAIDSATRVHVEPKRALTTQHMRGRFSQK
ncbi:hypothetical protein P4S68_04775 [Pseudoalteromonas sp. Hal099]